MSVVIKADASGAVMLPADLCQAAGVAPGAEWVAQIEAGRIILEPARPPIWERIVALTRDAPRDALDNLPDDLAAQHDHYLYGSPKRPQ